MPPTPAHQRTPSGGAQYTGLPEECLRQGGAAPDSRAGLGPVPHDDVVALAPEPGPRRRRPPRALTPDSVTPYPGSFFGRLLPVGLTSRVTYASGPPLSNVSSAVRPEDGDNFGV